MLIILLSAVIIFMFSQPAASSSHELLVANNNNNNSANCLNQTCGSLTVAYPFRLRTRTTCPTFSSFFELECNICASGEEKLYLNNVAVFLNESAALQVIEIQNDSLIVDITQFKVVLNSSCGFGGQRSTLSLPSFPGPYFIADDNKFAGFGCSYATLYAGVLDPQSPQDYYDIEYSDYSRLEMGGCYVLYPADRNNPDCGNHNCCVSSIPGGLSPRYVYYQVSPYSKLSTGCDNISCSFSFATLFHPYYTDFGRVLYRLKLKWALPSTQTTPDEVNQSSDYACSRNANHTIIDVVPGYVCSCQSGYIGDGYSNGSDCSDIDECKDPSTNRCILGSTTCHNREGNYKCVCNSQFHVGNGRSDGSGCQFSPHLRNAFVITAAILGLALFVGGFIILAIWWKQRTKRKYFMQNGGLELEAYIAARGRGTTRLFSAEQLKAATNNFSDNMKLGIGGFGTVFKGTIEDGRVVAIKKANRGKDEDSEQFLNEMTILMNINHRHIVRLLGCCLETVVPLLVYEYVSNGTVAENLESNGAAMIRWEQRLKVARQTAEALAYLHAAASPPILHRDVKSMNVLLDDNLDAKVADFGASRLVPDGADHVSTGVQGTLGYLDPEYFRTLQLTHKSDVYSLGVMLAELITGLKPVDSLHREPGFANLACFFIDLMEKGRGEELIDPRLAENRYSLPWRTRSSIMAVASLAYRCLALLGFERPSMSQVADELRHITQAIDHQEDDHSLPLLPSKTSVMQSESHSMWIASNLTMPR